MARPKTGKPPKKGLTLTVTEETREDLDFLSMYHNESISALVAEWSAKTAKSLAAQTNNLEASAGPVTRQKTDTAPFRNLNISVSVETRDELQKISQNERASISHLVTVWAHEAAAALRNATSEE